MHIDQFNPYMKWVEDKEEFEKLLAKYGDTSYDAASITGKKMIEGSPTGTFEEFISQISGCSPEIYHFYSSDNYIFSVDRESIEH